MIRRHFGIIFFAFMTFNCFAQASTERSVNYIKINNFSSPTVSIASINDFVDLMNENKTANVFVTDRLFLIQGLSLMYTIETNGYKNVSDYKAGNDKEFANGESYYFALENNIPNQNEVDYFYREGFITVTDYHEAVRLGFTSNNISEIRIYGLMPETVFQSNIKLLNNIAFLMYRKNWQAADRQRPIQNPLLDNTNADTLINNFWHSGQLMELNNLGYYYFNIRLNSERDSVFYYASKFCQFLNMNEFNNNTSDFTIKGTDQIIRQLSFDSIAQFFDANQRNIPNGNDYKLVVAYNITMEQLNQSRALITELERIKQRQLANVNDSVINSFRVHGYSIENIAFIIHNLQRLPRNRPITYSNFSNSVRNEYYFINPLAFDENALRLVFEYFPQVKSQFIVSDDSFYRR